MRARDFRQAAHEKCVPFSGRLALIELLYNVIIGALNGVAIIVGGPFELSLAKIQEKVGRGENPDYGDIFLGFNDFVASLILFLLRGIYTFLWSLLFIIPGIIADYAYSMTYFILSENPGMAATEAIKESKEMMKGHKWELFCLDFSYIGWIILSIFTFGILLFWVNPKMRQARYQFYLNLKGNK